MDKKPAQESYARNESGTVGFRFNDSEGISDYFRWLRRRLQLGILVAYILPLALLSIYFHFQFNNTLRQSGKVHLTVLAESQRNIIDMFLQERVVNIFNLFHGSDFKLDPSENEMRVYLQHLREVSDAFLDVGFLDASGTQIGYAGPYSYLQGKDYSDAQWFQTLMKQERNYHISDIYLGLRKKPHFTMAVKQPISGKTYIIRATLDPDKFYLFLRNISRGKDIDSVLINREGKYQVVDPDHGELLGASDYMPPETKGTGSHEITTQNGNVLIAYTWLGEVPWLLAVRQPFNIAYADMYRVRKIMIVATAVLVALLFIVIWLPTDKLLARAQESEESKQELQSQLFHAAKLVSVGELAAGVAHEINNPLAIISTETGVIKDMFDPQFGLECTPEKIMTELGHIDRAVFRARDITQKLLSFVRRTDPRLIDTDINSLVDDITSGLMEREFKVSNIKLVRDYDSSLPKILIDPDQIRQVFLNLINNAGDAIGDKGTITLTTSQNEEHLCITVADTGKGMTSAEMGKIFMPFYTTKEVGKGTGLGLAISLSIVEAMGGRIEVQSMPGAGSSFTVKLPKDKSEDV